MRIGPLRLVVIVVVAIVLAYKVVDWMRPEPPLPLNPTGGSGLAGAIVEAPGQGIPGATVVVRRRGGDTKAVWTATADAAGRFEFGALPAGRYTVGGGKTGFASSWYAASLPEWGPTEIDLPDGGRISGLEVSLVRHASILGTVTDASRRPLAAHYVRALRIDSRGALPLGGGVQASTDAEGRFAIPELEPGQYLVRVGRGGDDTFQLYYPAALNPSGMQTITLAPGQERTGLDITLPAAPTASLAGSVRTRDGVTLPELDIEILDANFSSPAMTPRSTRTNAQGRFELAGLPAGSYTIAADATVGTSNYSGLTTITTDGHTLRDVALMLERGSTVSGRILTDDPAGAQAELRFTAVETPTHARTKPFRISARAGQDGTFTLLDVPYGRYVLFTGSDDFVQWTRTRGTTTTAEFVDVPRGGIADLEVSLTTADAAIEGRVRTPDGPVTAAAVVVAFPIEATAVIGPTRTFRTARPSTSGWFTIEMLPAGDFAVVAVATLPVEPWRNAVVLDQLRSMATRVSIPRNGRKTVDLIVR